MKIRNLALVLGAAFTVAAGGFAATACSSNSPAVTGPGYDSGTVRDSSTGNDSGNTGNDSGMMGSDAGTGADCGDVALRPGDGGSLYCPFGPDGGQYVTCSSSGFCHLDCPTATTYCCIGGGKSPNYYASACQTVGQACDNPPADAGLPLGRPVQCEEAADCQGGDAGPMICCATGSVPTTVPGCGYDQEKGLKATTCTAGTTCASGFQVCSTDAECGSGHTCKPFKALGMQLGWCQ